MKKVPLADVPRLRQRIGETVRESLRVQEAFFSKNADTVLEAFALLRDTIRKGGKILIAGNGGSAADAQHLAAELVNRYLCDRPPVPAVALTTDTSVLTSIANDSDFGHVFSRQVEALGKPGDLLVAITTSGNSPNILQAVRAARRIGISTLALTGGQGGSVCRLADLTLRVSDSSHTPRIQETLLLLEHILCELLEAALFPRPCKRSHRNRNPRRTHGRKTP